MFEGFKHVQLQTSDPQVTINLRYGGTGPGLLLLQQIHGVCEDYRAAATLDFEMDTADFDAGHKITCPVLVLWGDKSHVEQYFNPREAWPEYATDVVRYVVVPAGHYPQEQAPDEVYAALDRFFRE